jgi:hypothetical protein
MFLFPETAISPSIALIDAMAKEHPEYSAPSVLAIVSAIASFNFGAALGFLLAVAAIVLGVIGVLLAASPSIRGGLVSIVSVIGGVIGIVAAVLKLLF